MRTRSQDITDLLRQKILSGGCLPGEKLEEIPLAEALGVSRTPVRAALTLLAQEGLIDYQPKRGYQVHGFTPEEIFAAYEVRAAIEGLACRLAAQNGIDRRTAARLEACLAEGDAILAKGTLQPEDFRPYQTMNVTFHDTIISLSTNPWVERFVEQTHAIPLVSDRVILWHDHAVILRSHDDHHRILTAIERRQTARAEDLMREHVTFAGEFLRENFHRVADPSAASQSEVVP